MHFSMYHYYDNLLPSSFANVFQTVASMHSYHTRLASKSTYYINTIKKNHNKFNIHFAAVKVWNHLEKSIKHLPLKKFKNKVKLNILQSYFSWVFNWSLLLFLFSLSYFSFFFFCPLFFTNNLLCSSFSANLRPIFKHYLLLLSWIRFSVILSKCYLFCINILSV